MVARANGEGGGGVTAAKKNVGSVGRAGAMLNAAADLDLVKACLSCGLPVGAAVGAVADSGGSQFVDVWKGTGEPVGNGGGFRYRVGIVRRK